MKKIPSLFVRDYENIITNIKLTHVSTNMYGGTGVAGSIDRRTKGRFLATHEVTPGCEWVMNGEGTPTRKWDGTAILIKEGILYKRYDAKNGKIPPDSFIPCQEPDEKTGHWPGWIQCFNADPSNKYIFEAFTNTFGAENVDPIDGTYEAIGPKIGGNKDKWDRHELRKHGDMKYNDVIGITQPTSYYTIKQFLSDEAFIEGVVFHHPDGRMCKVKRSDFGLKW